MPRPHKCRNVAASPRVTVFKPAGVPAEGLETIELGLDELEALRLADIDGLYQDAAAERMGISRATFGRLIQTARHRVATALVEGRVLVFEGGTVAVRSPDMRMFACGQCSARFEIPFAAGRPASCPDCSSQRVFRDDGESRHGRRRRRGCGGRWGRNGVRQGEQRGRFDGGPRSPSPDKGE